MDLFALWHRFNRQLCSTDSDVVLNIGEDSSEEGDEDEMIERDSLDGDSPPCTSVMCVRKNPQPLRSRPASPIKYRTPPPPKDLAPHETDILVIKTPSPAGELAPSPCGSPEKLFWDYQSCPNLYTTTPSPSPPSTSIERPNPTTSESDSIPEVSLMFILFIVVKKGNATSSEFYFPLQWAFTGVRNLNLTNWP